MYHLVENLRKVSIMLNPAISHTSDEILRQLGINEKDLTSWDSIFKYDLLQGEHKVIEKGEPLFVRLEMEEEVEYIREKMKG